MKERADYEDKSHGLVTRQGSLASGAAGVERPWLAHYAPTVPRELSVPNEPLTWLLDEARLRAPGNVAISYYGTRVTYAQFAEQVESLAAALRALGLRPGDRVSLCLPNAPQFPIAFYAVLRAGGVVVPTNPLYTAPELEHQLNDSGARIIIALDRVYPVIAAVRARTPLEHVVVTSAADYFPRPLALAYWAKEGRKYAAKVPRDDAAVHWFRAVLASGARDRQQPLTRTTAGPDDLAVLQYTGGTTGVAKGAMLTHHNLLANAIQTWHWNEQPLGSKHSSLCVAPFFHVYGLTVGMNMTMYNASTMVLLPRFTVDETLAAIRRERPDLFPGVPTMYLALARAAEERHLDLSAVKVCISGSAPLPLEVQQRFEKVSGARVVEGYGLTEASPVTHCNPVFGDRRIGTIGLPLPGTDAAIADSETGELLPPGAEGEIVVRGPQVMRGYWQRPDETSKVLRDGWLRTGDLGHMSEDGYFTIVDRAKDVIIASGYKIFPRDVEEVLFAHPDVLEASVIGVPDPYRGETVRAYIVAKPGARPTAEALTTYCREHLAAYKVPKQFVFVESLPKSVIGKVLRRELRAQALAEMAAQSSPAANTASTGEGASTSADSSAEARESRAQAARPDTVDAVDTVANQELRASTSTVASASIAAAAESAVAASTPDATTPHEREEETSMAIEQKTETAASFLTTPVTEEHFFTPEKLTDEQRQIRDSARTFVEREVLPRSEAIEHQEPGVTPGLIKEAGEQGLLMIDIPEEYGGAELGLLVSSLVASQMRQASFAVAFGAHTSIGTLPIVYYGNAEQKAKYLPKLATGELIGSYALTEPGVGSDAMSIHTRATLSPDGKHYILNGAKQWITNSGFADLAVVFAKVDDTKHTAFIVEMHWPGVSTGAEEKKMGIKGSSTRTLYLDNVQVPVENVLGEIGKGYKIAFNILNIGRLKLGVSTAEGAKAALTMAATYANERKAFGRPLSGFGMIKKKLAAMASDVYAAESLVFRTAGNVEAAREAATDELGQLAAVEEYAIECSIAKVFGSEVLARCADEGVQIFGGYGFMDEYPISAVYRDARINRIFEGTNEVNRLVTAGTIFRRAMAGKLDLFSVFPAIDEQVSSGKAPDFAGEGVPANMRESVNLLERAKRAGIYSVMKGAMKFMSTMEEEQEFLEYVANQVIDTYAMDSAVARALDAAASGAAAADVHAALAQLTVLRLLPDARAAMEGAITMALEGDERAEELAKVRAYLGDPQAEIVPLQRQVAGLVIEHNGYPLA